MPHFPLQTVHPPPLTLWAGSAVYYCSMCEAVATQIKHTSLLCVCVCVSARAYYTTMT